MKKWINFVLAISLATPTTLLAQQASTVSSHRVAHPYLVSSHEEALPKSYRRSIKTIQSGSLYFDINFQLSTSGTPEMVVSLIESRKGMSDTSIPVAYGRDVTGDNKMDIWLIPDEENGVNGLIRPSQQHDGWDVLPDILLRNANIEKRSTGRLLFNLLTTTLSFSLLRQEGFFKDLVQQQMDIIDLELRLELLKQKGIHPKHLVPFYQLASDGWSDVLKKIQREFAIDLGLAVVDGFTFVLIPKGVAKLGSAISSTQQKIFAKLSPKVTGLFQNISQKELPQHVSRLYNSFRRGVSQRAHISIEKFNKYTLNALPVAGHALTRFIHKSIAKQTQLTLRALNSHNVIEKAAWNTLSTSLLLANEGVIRLPYVAQTLGVQVVAELITRKEALTSGDPIIVKQNTKEMGQNMGYMSTETLMQASISSALSNVNKRMSICAVLSLNNSLGASLLLNGEPDAARQSLDTRWEVLVGNLQTQIDIEALKLFDQMATQSKNPKLKLVGYAVAIVDQFAGYILYSLATQKLSEAQKERGSNAQTLDKPQVVLLPILVESSDVDATPGQI